jgi:hypothetical protein
MLGAVLAGLSASTPAMAADLVTNAHPAAVTVPLTVTLVVLIALVMAALGKLRLAIADGDD